MKEGINYATLLTLFPNNYQTAV